MAPKSVGVRELRAKLSGTLAEVANSGAPLEVKSGKHTVATIVPGRLNPGPLPGTAPAAPVQPAGQVGPLGIIAVTSLKGGVGKTTISMHLAATIARERGPVTVLDADEEVSAVRWQKHAEAEGLTLPFDVVTANRNTLMRQAKGLAQSGHTVIIDTPANQREVLKSAASVAGMVLVPVLPTSMDVDRLGSTLDLLMDLEAALDGLNYAVVLNRYDGRKNDAKDTNRTLDSVPRLSGVIRALSAYERVFGQVPSYLTEFETLWQELKGTLEGRA